MNVGGTVLGSLKDHRVDEADEWRVRDAVVDLEVVGLLFLFLGQLLLDRGPGAERLGRSRQAADLGQDVVPRRHGELERITRGEPQLVDSLDVARVGNSDLQGAVLERVRNGSQPLENVQRDLASGLLRDTCESQVDHRHLVARCEGARETFARGEILLHERVRERAHAGGSPDQGQLVRRNQAGGCDQVGDELPERVDRWRRAAQARATGWCSAPGLGAGGAQIRWTLDVHLSLVRGIGSGRLRLDPGGSTSLLRRPISP